MLPLNDIFVFIIKPPFPFYAFSDILDIGYGFDIFQIYATAGSAGL